MQEAAVVASRIFSRMGGQMRSSCKDRGNANHLALGCLPTSGRRLVARLLPREVDETVLYVGPQQFNRERVPDIEALRTLH